MRLMFALALLLAFAPEASARMGGLGAGHGLRPAALPMTEADLDRAGLTTRRPPTIVDNFVAGLGLRNGSAEIFNNRDTADTGVRFSGTIDARGAALRLKW